MHPFRLGRVTRISMSCETKKMKANFSINDIIHIQVVSRLADLLFDPAPENRCTRRTPQPFVASTLKPSKTPPLLSESPSTYCAESQVRVPLGRKTIKETN